MKARYSYVLLFLPPSILAAFMVTFIVIAVGGGLLWIYVYGDNVWPQSALNTLMAIALTATALTLATPVALSYSFGKRQEAKGGLSRSHMRVAVFASVGLPLLMLMHQLYVGNI